MTKSFVRPLLLLLTLGFALPSAGCIIRTRDHHHRGGTVHRRDHRGAPPGCKINGAGKTVCPPGHRR